MLLTLVPVWGFAQEGTGGESMSPGEKAAREIAIAEAAARRVLQLRAHPDFAEANRRAPGLEPSLSRAQRLLRAAKSGLANAERSRSATAFSDASVLARRANQEFEGYEKSVLEAFSRLDAERAPPTEPEAVPELEAETAATAAAGSKGAIDREPADGPAPPAEAPAADRESAAPETVAEKGVTEAPSQPPEVEAAPPPSEPEPQPPPAAVPPRRSGPPAQLLSAADAYFAGEYQQAVDLLSSTFRQKQARAHALLLRAAAHYALFLLGGETDYALRAQATEDVTACRRADPGLEPDERFFSPRFRDFFAATR